MSQEKSSSERSSSSPKPSSIDNSSERGVRSGDRLHFMRQQFYTNNDRWSSGARLAHMDSDGRQQAVKSSSQKQQRPSQLLSAQSASQTTATTNTTTATDVRQYQANISSHHPSNRLANITNTSKSIYNFSDNSSLANRIAALGSALTTALVSSATTSSDPYEQAPTSPVAGIEHDSGATPEECHTPAALNNMYDCNPDSSDLLRSLRIVPEETNFSDYNDVWLVKSWQEILLRVSFVAPIVLVGLLGNLMIIYSMCKFKTIRSKPTNMFILNMALADLLTSIFCPNAALFSAIFQFYVLGPFVCRFEGSIKITCLLVSAYSLIVLSFDWFLCVVKPCRKRITIKQTLLTLVAIWIVSIAMSLPLAYYRGLRQRQWKDLDEVWCCESIKETKQYWMVITLFLIYLPTFVMTVVLVVILCQMDKFEAKLKKARQLSSLPNRGPTSNSTTQTTNSVTNTTSATILKSTSGTNSNGSPANVSRFTGTGQNNLNGSVSINMKYKRRIVKILFFYLLTSIVCWSPLQFVIVYRHFRNEAQFSGWYPELTFYSQLCATLSSAMNPIIFGFLSQPFRRVVTKSWIFCVVNKIWTTKTRNRSDPAKNENYAMDLRRVNDNNNNNNNNNIINQHHINRNNLNYARSSQRITRETDQPKLTIDYIEHDHQQLSGRVTTTGGGGGGAPAGSIPSASGRRVSIISNSHHSHRNHHHRPNMGSFNGNYLDRHRGSLTIRTNGQSHKRRSANIHRSLSSRDPEDRQTGLGKDACNHNKRVSFNGNSQLATINTNGSAGFEAGIENGAYVRDDGVDAETELGAHQSQLIESTRSGPSDR